MPPADKVRGGLPTVSSDPQAQRSISRLRQINSDPLALPLTTRVLSPALPNARALHFRYELEVLNEDIYCVRIIYQEHGTDLQRVWAEEIIPASGNTPPRRLPPQWSLRGVRYEFTLSARKKDRELSVPTVYVNLRCDFIEEEETHIRNWDGTSLFIVLDGDVLDLRILKDLALAYKLSGPVSLAIKVFKLVAGRTNPVLFIVDIVVSEFIIGPAVEGLAEKYGKVHIRKVIIHCGLCKKMHELKDLEPGQEIQCPGCGASFRIRVK